MLNNNFKGTVETNIKGGSSSFMNFNFGNMDLINSPILDKFSNPSNCITSNMNMPNGFLNNSTPTGYSDVNSYNVYDAYKNIGLFDSKNSSYDENDIIYPGKSYDYVDSMYQDNREMQDNRCFVNKTERYYGNQHKISDYTNNENIENQFNFLNSQINFLVNNMNNEEQLRCIEFNTNEIKKKINQLPQQNNNANQKNYNKHVNSKENTRKNSSNSAFIQNENMRKKSSNPNVIIGENTRKNSSSSNFIGIEKKQNYYANNANNF